MRLLFFLLYSALSFASEVPNFRELGETKGAVIFLSSKRSGSNLVSGSLSIITGKPISWLQWGYRIFNANSRFKEHPSYNRLDLPLVSDEPLLYRTHFDFERIRKIPSSANQLIFVTRNPKELIFRDFYLQDVPSFSAIEEFIDLYLEAFEIYDSWKPENRFLVFYEDFIRKGDEILLELLAFMNEPPLFFNEYQMHREEYLNQILESYKKQHQNNHGGASAQEGPKEIYYTESVPVDVLHQIDAYIKRKSPAIWENYLQRFRTE